MLSRSLRLTLAFNLSFSGQFVSARTFTEAWPESPSADPFQLIKQSWDLGTRNSKTARLLNILGLASMTEEIPVDKAPTFDKFLVEIEDGHLVIREAVVARKGADADSHDPADLRVKDGGASHHFDGVRPLRWSVDKDLLIVLDTAGVVHAIDMHLLKTVAYRAPVPVFRLTEIQNFAALGENLEARFVTERDWRLLNAKPRADGLRPLNRPADHRWHAGDWALLHSTDQKSEVVLELDRGVILQQIGSDEAVLAYWSDLVHPQADSRSSVEVNADLPLDAALAVRRLDPDTVRRLMPNSQAWLNASIAPRDQFKMLGDNRFGVPTPETLKQRITPRGMLAIASAVAGGAVLAEGMRRFGYDYGFAHGVRIVFDHLYSLVPAVMTDAVYKHTLMKGAFWLALVAPAIWATAALYGKVTGSDDDPKVIWVRAGMRTFAKINQPFWRPMAKLLGQPHIIKALSLGVNPFRQIAPDSRIGQRADLKQSTHLGYVSPLNVGAKRRVVVTETKRALRAVEDQANERVALARWLALMAVARETNLDPASIAEEGEEVDEKTRRSEEAKNQRRRELAQTLARSLAQRDVDARGLSEEELGHELERARFAAARLKQRGRPERYWDRARYEWNRLASGTLRGLYDFARAENDFWETAEPTKVAADRAWGIFISDYYLGTTFALTEGPRADLHDPASLAAQEGAFMNISPGGRYDILDTPRWYSINHNAKFTRVFMGEAELKTDPAYEPRETKDFEPNWRSPHPWEAFVLFAKDFVNPSKGEYAETILNQLKVAFAMIQTSFLLTTSARVIFAGSDLQTSSLSFVYHFIWGHIQAGLFFDFINQTISLMKKHYARNRFVTRQATNAIGQGTRLGDEAQYRAGVAALLKLYEGREHRFSPALQQQVAEARATGPDVIQMEQANNLMFAALAEPPLPGKEPKWLEGLSYVVGVGLSTYAGLKMSVPTFGDHVDWNYLIGSSALWATGFYLAIYTAKKSWRSYQKNQEEFSCEASLAPALPPSPLRGHAS